MFKIKNIKIRSYVFLKVIFILIFICMSFLYFIGKLYVGCSIPPNLFKFEAWRLTDMYNNTFGSSELKGKVTVLNLFFTRCPSICPKLMNVMKKVNNHFCDFENSINFVSISIDYGHDQPSVLKKYKENNNIIASNWFFLTGDKFQIDNVIDQKMKLHSGQKQFSKVGRDKKKYDIDHFGQLVLLDQSGNLRGVFSIDDYAVLELECKARLLINNETVKNALF